MSDDSAKKLGLIVDIALLKGLTDAITRTPEEIQLDKDIVEKDLRSKENLQILIDEHRKNVTVAKHIMSPTAIDYVSANPEVPKAFV